LGTNSSAKIVKNTHSAKEVELFQLFYTPNLLKIVVYTINFAANLTTLFKRNNGIFLLLIREIPILQR